LNFYGANLKGFTIYDCGFTIVADANAWLKKEIKSTTFVEQNKNQDGKQESHNAIEINGVSKDRANAVGSTIANDSRRFIESNPPKKI